MTVVMFMVLQKPVTASIVSPEDFKRRRLAWIVVTVAAFASHNFWVYMFATWVIAWISLQRERNPLALYMSILFVVPMFKMPIPGFGIVNYFFDLDHQRVLALVIMMSMAFRLIQARESGDMLQRTLNTFVLAYWAMQVGHYAVNDSPTATARMAVELLLSMWLPFYVASRGISSVRQIREVMMMVVMAMAIFGLIAVFEMLRGWHLYQSLRIPLGVRLERVGSYVFREGAGASFLRANASGGGSIMLGQMMMVGICYWVALRKALLPTWRGWVVLGFVVAGIVAAMSRGPWLGAMVGVAVLTLTGPGMLKRVGMVTGVSIAVVGILLVTPWGNTVLNYMPFVGNVESENVDYRVRLFEISMLVFWENPIFGSFRPLMDFRMEELRQGQGIIDLVNHYLGVGLFYGLIGLFLFVTPFVMAMWKLLVVSREVEQYNPTVGITGRALLGAMFAIMFTIATTSLLEFIPVLMWMSLGFAANFVTNARRVVAQHQAAAAQSRMYGVRNRPASSASAPPLGGSASGQPLSTS